MRFSSEATNQLNDWDWTLEANQVTFSYASASCAKTDKATKQKHTGRQEKVLISGNQDAEPIRLLHFMPVWVIFLYEIVLTVLPLFDNTCDWEPCFPLLFPCFLLFFYALLKFWASLLQTLPSWCLDWMREPHGLLATTVLRVEAATDNSGRTGLHRGNKLQLQQQEHTFDLKSHFVFFFPLQSWTCFFFHFLHYHFSAVTALFLFGLKNKFNLKSADSPQGLKSTRCKLDCAETLHINSKKQRSISWFPLFTLARPSSSSHVWQKRGGKKSPVLSPNFSPGRVPVRLPASPRVRQGEGADAICVLVWRGRRWAPPPLPRRRLCR